MFLTGDFSSENILNKIYPEEEILFGHTLRSPGTYIAFLVTRERCKYLHIHRLALAIQQSWDGGGFFLLTKCKLNMLL